MIKTRFSFCVHVGNRGLLTELGKGWYLFLAIWYTKPHWAASSFPRAAVSISAHACLWLIIRMRHSLFFVLSPYFICLPSPGLLRKHHVVMEMVATTNLSSPNSRCPWVTSSYLWTKQQLMKVMIIKINVYPQLTLDVPPEKILESLHGTCALIWRQSLYGSNLYWNLYRSNEVVIQWCLIRQLGL